MECSKYAGKCNWVFSPKKKNISWIFETACQWERTQIFCAVDKTAYSMIKYFLFPVFI